MVNLSDEDEYDLYDHFSDLTKEQLAELDVASSSAPSSSKTIPRVRVEIEDPEASNSAMADNQKPSIIGSPLRQFRPNNVISVTDLVSPAWCEVQFDYGLRQKRHRRLPDRPASFTTEQGTEIFVDKVVAAAADQNMKRGKSVHKRLEREIQPEQVQVQISTEEERWGLRYINIFLHLYLANITYRIINMIDCVELLLLSGCAREMPVFGIVKGNVVLGIIDEVVLDQPTTRIKRELKSPPSTPQKPKRARVSPSQLPITTFLSSSSVPLSSDTFITPYSFHLIDTKTRRNSSLPREEDALSSRLQLMMYHRMLANLIASSTPFDFNSFWRKLGLDEAAPFSPKFLAQTLLTRDEQCLKKLTQLWFRKTSQLRGIQLSSTLQLIYRSQTKYRGRRQKNQHLPVISSKEEQDIATAVAASLRDVQMLPKVNQADAGGSVVEQKAGSSIEDPEVQREIEQSLLSRLDDAGLNLDYNQDDTRPQTDIIGTREFEVDHALLDNYLLDIMRWWNGERKPRGVSLEQSGRCLSVPTVYSRLCCF
ncbi:hypothetical protein D9757_010842 [Collybiopsis confluens]|uniref:Uncharacterized protein n=1 Tax=Collybiopsis confluens TaxID=2823264 RepID=A0A8H5GL38_9AGAR|nr:hypothetical protein D9757_010842 [Collybiopsis confluens]